MGHHIVWFVMGIALFTLTACSSEQVVLISPTHSPASADAHIPIAHVPTDLQP